MLTWIREDCKYLIEMFLLYLSSHSFAFICLDFFSYLSINIFPLSLHSLYTFLPRSYSSFLSVIMSIFGGSGELSRSLSLFLFLSLHSMQLCIFFVCFLSFSLFLSIIFLPFRVFACPDLFHLCQSSKQ